MIIGIKKKLFQAQRRLRRFRKIYTSWLPGMVNSILFLVYDFIFLLGFTVYLPVYVWRRKVNISSLWEKFGFIHLPERRKTVWIQVVSVGEANLIGSLIRRLREVCDYSIVISTTTLTGNRVVKSEYASIAKVIFFPLDLSFVLWRAIKIINPEIFIAVETEIWPNLYCRLRRKNIPIVIVNGRISDKAYKRYKLIKPFIKGIINKCNYIGVQSEAYRDRFLHLGAKKEKIIIGGNMKFESISIDQSKLLKHKEKYAPILKKESSLLLIAASTHCPEEETIINIYRNIFNIGNEVTLLIVPRHPERTSSIENIIKDRGFKPVRISKISHCPSGKDNIFIADTIGELLYFYSLADICFVGGSLSPDGGHNVLEPIYFLKPTVFGPNMQNFQDIEEVVLKKGAGFKIRNADELEDMLIKLISDKALRNNLRGRCLEVFEREKLSLENNLQIILRCLAADS